MIDLPDLKTLTDSTFYSPRQFQARKTSHAVPGLPPVNFADSTIASPFVNPSLERRQLNCTVTKFTSVKKTKMPSPPVLSRTALDFQKRAPAQHMSKEHKTTKLPSYSRCLQLSYKNIIKPEAHSGVLSPLAPAAAPLTLTASRLPKHKHTYQFLSPKI